MNVCQNESFKCDWHVVQLVFIHITKDVLSLYNSLSLTPSFLELKAVLQRSPIRFWGNRGDLPTCTEHPSSGEEAQRAQEADRGA